MKLPFTPEELQSAFLWWLKSDFDHPEAMLRRMGLPGTRRRVLIVLRDTELLAAAENLGLEPGSHAQAMALQRACRRFQSYRWPAWAALEEPPDHASEIERHLFLAWRFNRWAGASRDGQPHDPGDWGLTRFRTLVAALEMPGKRAAVA